MSRKTEVLGVDITANGVATHSRHTSSYETRRGIAVSARKGRVEVVAGTLDDAYDRARPVILSLQEAEHLAHVLLTHVGIAARQMANGEHRASAPECEQPLAKAEMAGPSDSDREASAKSHEARRDRG